MPISHPVSHPSTDCTSLTVRWAVSEEDLAGAQKLRSLAFGFSDPDTPYRHIPRESDPFDPHARHLIVVDARNGLCVGTYRLLDWSGAKKAGGFYTETEFDIRSLTPWLPDILEVGRSCVHPSYRKGGVITLLWSALARILASGSIHFLMGCASLDLTDPALDPDRVYSHLVRHGWSTAMEPLPPRRPFSCLLLPEEEGVPALPPLLKGYLRLGARCIGHPSHDPVFNTADFPIWLPVSSMRSRYARHFFRQPQNAGSPE